MAKESSSTQIPSPSSIAAPMFAFARTVLDEIDQQSDRYLQLGAGQAGEAAALWRTMRAQTSGLSRTLLGTLEQLTGDALDAATAWQKTFGRGLA